VPPHCRLEVGLSGPAPFSPVPSVLGGSLPAGGSSPPGLWLLLMAHEAMPEAFLGLSTEGLVDDIVAPAWAVPPCPNAFSTYVGVFDENPISWPDRRWSRALSKTWIPRRDV